MNAAVSTHIDALRALLRDERDVQRVAEQIPPTLETLRGMFRTHRTAFRAEDVRFLKQAARAAEAAADFCDLVEDLPDVRVNADAVAYMEELSEMDAVLHDAAVGRRVRREIRALRERFPEAAQRAAEAARTHRIRALETRAWPCRCGEAMTLRTGNTGDHYWGCSTYPRCSHTHALTDKQRAFLESADT